MLKWRRRNNCGYWGCSKRIPDEQFLCTGHYGSWEDGLIDQCPQCGRFKDVMYQQCLDCYVGRAVPPWQPRTEIPAPKQKYRVEYSEAWIDGYLRSDRFFVYILQYDDGNLYVGHTADISKRLSEQKVQKTSAASGSNPGLQYLQIIATERAAELREAELKKLITSNPGQIQLMVADFRDHMRGLGYQ